MIKNASHRAMYFLGFIVIALLLAAASYLELYQGVIPCPLCIMQRMVLAVLGILFLLGIVIGRNKYGRGGVGLFSVFFSAFGAFLSGWQVWLQHTPGAIQMNCDVSIEYMLKVLPLKEVIKAAFVGSSTCTEAGWTFLYLSLAEWSFVVFIAFLLFSLLQLFRKA